MAGLDVRLSVLLLLDPIGTGLDRGQLDAIPKVASCTHLNRRTSSLTSNLRRTAKTKESPRRIRVVVELPFEF